MMLKNLKLFYQNYAVTFVVVTGFVAVPTFAQEVSFSESFTGVQNADGITTGGAAWADVDGDGRPDLILANMFNKSNSVYRNLGDGNFTLMENAGIGEAAGSSSFVTAADYDNDGDMDLYFANQSGQDNFLFRNSGDGTFNRVSSGAIVGDGGNSYSAAWADYDNDGFLDLFVANQGGEANFLYHNNGDGTFSRNMDSVIVQETLDSFSGVWADYDNDGDQDLFVANFAAQEPNSLFRNDGEEGFYKVDYGPITFDASRSEGASWGDYDNDGDLDLFVANGPFFPPDGDVNFLYENLGDGSFAKVLEGPMVEMPNTAGTSQWADIDNDGDLDLLLAIYRGKNRIFLNDGYGEFSEDLQSRFHHVGGPSSGLSMADYNQDGKLDAYLTNWVNHDNRLLTNTTEGGNFIAIRLVGTVANANAIGAKLTLRTRIDGDTVSQIREVGTTTGSRGQNDVQVHFGIGDASRANRLIITWPSGEETRLGDLRANHFYSLIEGRNVVDEGEALVPSVPLANAMYSAYNERGVEAAKNVWFQRTLNVADKTPYIKDLIIITAIVMGVNDQDGDILMGYLAEQGLVSAELSFQKAEGLRREGDMLNALSFYNEAVNALLNDSFIDADMAQYIRATAGRFLTTAND
jgi:hypothetical protein